MPKTPFDYELALSYAHKDEDIAAIISEELKNIFQDKFFKDSIQQHELADASDFKNKLRSIFGRAHYAVILYSPNYQKGEFTQVELKEIIDLCSSEADRRFFIININDTSPEGTPISELTYNLITLPSKLSSLTAEEKSHLKEQIKEIVHARIKKYIIRRTLDGSADSYGISVRTLFAEGNTPIWEPQYNWNLFTTEFVNAESRTLKPEYTWDDLWNYVKTDFNTIYEHIRISGQRIKCTINLNCHLSIAFKLGLLYGQLNSPFSQYRNLVLVSGKGHCFTFSENRIPTQSETAAFIKEEKCGNDPGADSIVCTVSASLNGRDLSSLWQTQEKSIEKGNISCKKRFLFHRAGNIENADLLEQIVDSLAEQLTAARADEYAENIHLFLDAPAVLAFVLGNHKVFPGKVILYEYDQKQDRYYQSLERND